MDHNPVQTMNAYEAVLQRLLNGIKSGEFKPGTKLPSVRQLSLDWQVGQPTIREALSALKAMNLVRSRQGEGTFVNALGPEQISSVLRGDRLMSGAEVTSLLELRMILETGTASLAARRRTTADLKALHAVLEEMEADLAFVDLGEQADWKFHYQLAKATQNPFLPHLMDSIREQMQSSLLASRLSLYRTEGEPELLLQQHRTILEAVEEQNEKLAVHTMTAHLQHVEEKTNPAAKREGSV